MVVDEAQDLSPCSAARSPAAASTASITVLGDLAQGTAPWAAADWADSLAHLGKPGGRVVPLTTGFRVPAAVLVLANRLLPALAVDVPPAVSLRTDGECARRRPRRARRDDRGGPPCARRRGLGRRDRARRRRGRAPHGPRGAGIETATADEVEAAS